MRRAGIRFALVSWVLGHKKTRHGHPDKFCDQVADAVIAECVAIDPDAYGQVEVSTWSDQVWLSGGICTRKPLAKSMREIVLETGLALGYVPGNHIDANRYKVTSTVCERIGDPTQWSRHVNDQSVVIGCRWLTLRATG